MYAPSYVDEIWMPGIPCPIFPHLFIIDFSLYLSTLIMKYFVVAIISILAILA